MTSWSDTYFLPEEIQCHNKAQDCWVVIYRIVKNITALVNEFQGSGLERPLIAEAGKDISFWFDLDGCKPVLKTYLDQNTGLRVPLIQQRIPHAPDPEPDIRWIPYTDNPWWQDEKYNVGIETNKPVFIRLVNTLIDHNVIIKVCIEDKLERILQRYSLKYNPEISSYTVKYIGRRLVKTSNLLQNKVLLPYNEEISELVHEEYIPTIKLFYKERLAPSRLLRP